ncbi:MAG: hypothetical protein KGL53_03085 [Elusimicrobia bacterium]|nr:hypothetical protein [Elusimicrobiota bacterium]
MQHQRTQVYLDPSQHAALILEARRLDLSLAALIRRLVDEHFSRARGSEPGREFRREAGLSLMGLGASGQGGVSEDTDRHLAAALAADRVSERRGRYGKRSRRRGR